MPSGKVSTDEKSDGLRRILDAAWENPMQAGTLVCVICGGMFMYFNMISDSSAIKQSLSVASQRGSETNARQDQELEKQKQRIDRLETFMGDMRADIREATTNLRWLTRERNPNDKQP